MNCKIRLVLFTLTIVLISGRIVFGQNDSVVTTSCHTYSLTDGSDIDFISIMIYDSTGQLISTEDDGYGTTWDINGNLSYFFNQTLCSVYYDTTTSSDSSYCLKYENGNLISTNSTKTYYDSLKRPLQKIIYYNGGQSNRRFYQYDNFGNTIYYSDEYWNSTSWINQTKEFKTYSASGKQLSFVRLTGTNMDSTMMHKLYYDMNDSIIVREFYSRNSVQNQTYLAEMQERDFNIYGKLIEERFYNGDTTGLTYSSQFIYIYDVMSINGRVISVENYNAIPIPPELLNVANYYYDSTNAEYTYYIMNCDSGICNDTDYYVIINPDTYNYSSETYSAYLESDGTYSYHRVGSHSIQKNAAGQITSKSDFSSNYPPPLYSESYLWTYNYNADGTLEGTCYEHSGSHLNDRNTCCHTVYGNSPASLSVVLLADQNQLQCPGTPIGIGKIITGGEPPYTYSWNSIDIIDSSLMLSYATNETSAIYIITVSDAALNTASDTVLIQRISVVHNIADSIICFGEYINMTIDPSNYSPDQFFYTWNDTLIESFSNFISITNDGVYTFGITLDICPNDTIFTLPVYLVVDQPTISLEDDSILCINSPLTLTIPSGFVQYIWYNGDTTNSILLNSSFADTFLIYCTATDSQQCVATDSMLIVYSLCNYTSDAKEDDEMIKYLPSEKYFLIDNSTATNSQFILFKYNGQEILRSDIKPFQTIKIPVDLKTGVYLYILNSGTQFKSGKTAVISH